MVFVAEPLTSMPQVGIWHYVFSNPNNISLDKPLMIDGITGNHLTYGQVKSNSLRFRAGLHKFGFKKGDALCLFSQNKVDYAVVMFGTVAAGGALTPANPAYTAKELQYQLEQTKSKIVIASAETLAVALEAAKLAGIPKSNVFLFDDREIDGVQPYTKVLLADQEMEAVEYTYEEACSTIAYLCFSSGTTGRSKGVMTSHMNIASNLTQLSQHTKGTVDVATDRYLGVLPFYHIYGLTCMIHLAAFQGTPLVVLPRFELASFLNAIATHRVTFCHIVPPIFILLAKDPSVTKYDLSCVRYFWSGAAPLSKELSEAVAQRLNVGVLQGYGMTESSPVSHTPILSNIINGSIGELLPGMKARIVDESGKDVAPGERGELWMAGPNIMLGYLNMPDATAETIDKDGYLHTGDVAIMTEDKQWYIVDRVKELIKYKGFQVAPAELEALLLTYENVADCAIIGVYDPSQATELPRAYIKLVLGVEASDATAKAIIDSVAKSVANHKKLRGGVRFIAEIPKSAAGKILRKELRELANQEMKASVQSKI
ncbi:hypothetical protein INT44_008781 [Umbelopsis vinacea]|uniref:4-coumarate--CoA ligase n=1 Tax=Umbelopsis vinacea TaxID=44442 RepID=A0A8H7PGA4_9FUNG|nr:hypothetical protein INT44_008781 [Umbelopsis vinacea]